MGKYDFECDSLPIVHIDGKPLLTKKIDTEYLFPELRPIRCWKYSLNTFIPIKNEILSFGIGIKTSHKYHCFVDYGYDKIFLRTNNFKKAYKWLLAKTKEYCKFESDESKI